MARKKAGETAAPAPAQQAAPAPAPAAAPKAAPQQPAPKAKQEAKPASPAKEQPKQQQQKGKGKQPAPAPELPAAPAPAPAPVVPPAPVRPKLELPEAPEVIDPAVWAGMSENQKKNYRRRQKQREEKHAETCAEMEKQDAIQSVMGAMQHALEQDTHNQERLSVQKELEALYNGLQDLSKAHPKDVLSKFGEQKRVLEDVIERATKAVPEAQVHVKKPEGKAKSETLAMQLRDMEHSEEADADTMEWMRAQLRVTLSFESFKKFQNALTTLVKNAEDKLKSNNKAMDKARDWDRANRSLRKVCELKGLNIETLPAGANVRAVTLEPSAEVISALDIQRFSRKIERDHGVLLEKPSDKEKAKKAIVVTGFDDDITAACNVLKALDYSGKHIMRVDSKTASAIIGKGGATIRKIEQDCSVLVNGERDVFTIYGSKDNVAKALKFIQTAITDEQTHSHELTLPVGVGKSLVGVAGKGIRELETATNCSIKVDFRKEGDKVTIKGKREDVNAAIEKVKDFASRSTILEVPADKAVISKLFGAGNRGGEGEGEGRGPSKFALDFAVFRDSCGCTVQRKDGSITLVGKKEDVESANSKLNELIEKASHTTQKHTIMREQIKCFPEMTLQALIKKSGAQVSLYRGREGRDPQVEVTGNDAQKKQVEEEIKKILETEGHVETIDVTDESIRALIGKAGSKVREIEEKTGVSVNIDKLKMKASFVGKKDQIPKALKIAKTAIDSAEKVAANTVTKEVPVAKEHVRAIIGRGGATINNIRSSSGADRIDIKDDKGVVVIRGATEAVERAAKMINDILADEGAKTTEGGEGKTEKKETVAKEDKSPSKKEGAKAEGGAKKGKAKEVDTTTFDFPALPGKKKEEAKKVEEEEKAEDN